MLFNKKSTLIKDRVVSCPSETTTKHGCKCPSSGHNAGVKMPNDEIKVHTS